ncbi:MAG: CBS domain-containing protein [Sulfurovum sp.]|nr:CBS domain-containing protein [Sulfurovaceae bacterium]
MLLILENLKDNLPFSLIDNKLFRMIEESAQIAYYPKGTTLIACNDIPNILYIIIKGQVEAREDGELIDVYHKDDTVGGIEIIAEVSSLYKYIVVQELICYEIPSTLFLNLSRDNRQFKEYFFANISERMDMLQSKKEYGNVADLMVAKLDNNMLNRATVVEPNRDIFLALDEMERTKSVAIIVNNIDGYGIVTDADFRSYILKARENDITLISQIQTKPIISVKENMLMFNILLLMTEYEIKHLPVFDSNNNILGILELVHLLSLFSNQSHLITVQIDRAENIDDLIIASQRVSLMVGALHTKGVKSRYIAKMVAEIKKKMYFKIFTMIIPKDWHDKTAFLLLGSEGREEQILYTDQDNAIIFENGFMPDNISEVTEKFISILDKIGFPRCEGNVMIINPYWCKSVDLYKQDILLLSQNPNSDGFMNMAILFDSIIIAGNSSLHQEIIDYIFKHISSQKLILSHFAKAIENFESPLGLFSQFISKDSKHKDEIDIKKGAIFPLVHGIRALSLEYKIKETNTTLRIKELNNIGYINKKSAKELLEALEIVFVSLILNSKDNALIP